MGKGRKKRGTKSGDNAPKPAPSLLNGEEGLPLKAAAEDSHGFLQQEQVKPNAFNVEKTNVEAASSADNKNKAALTCESSSFQGPKKASSVPCRFFLRGYCRYGESCRFQHLEAVSTSTEPLNSAAKKPPNMHNKASSEKTCAPEECLDWYLTGSCPRYRTCRYAHPINRGVEGSSKNMKSGMHMDFGMAQLLLQGLGASRGGGRNDVMEQRMMNGGFTDDDVYELSLQGIKPWDPEAMDALAVLKGWDMDGGYDYDDYDYDDGDDELFGF